MIMVASGVVGVSGWVNNDVGINKGSDDGNGNVDEDSRDSDCHDGDDYGRQRYRWC